MRDDEQQLIAKLRKIEALFSRPGTEGERQAAETASAKVRARLRALENTEPLIEFRFPWLMHGQGPCSLLCCAGAV
jgi:hypothetical protein